MTTVATATHLEVGAFPRYWEDALVNGTPDDDGTAIPLRRGDAWCPVIRLADGYIAAWPDNVEAEIHYKVCDNGEYWLQDESGQRVAKWRGDYVPDAFLCHGDRGHGDYIMLRVLTTGFIVGWRAPRVHAEHWMPTETG